MNVPGAALPGEVARTTISVVIPCHDDAPFLARCLSALAAQTRPADEIIVVDNGSSDDSGRIAVAAGATVISEPVIGIPRAAAVGYDAARHEVIARLDADSVPGPDWLARIERDMARPDVEFITGTAHFYGGNPAIRWIGRHLYIGAMYVVLTPLLGHAPLFGSNMAMRATAWHELSAGFHRSEDRIHDDLDLSLHIRPDMGVLYDAGLVVQVSARPFENWPSLRRRLDRVLPTLRLHWPQEAPWYRLPARRRARKADAHSSVRE